MKNRLFIILFWCSFVPYSFTQQILWNKDGNSYFRIENNVVRRYELPAQRMSEVLNGNDLKPVGSESPLEIEGFSFNSDAKKILIFTNTQKVWRRNTRGDYWVYDIAQKSLKKLGKGLPDASLMFAKFSPSQDWVAYVSKRNIYVEDLATGEIRKLTDDLGTPKLINGTFDWVYEEEFSLRDGFRWSPDGKSIAYWQIDANKIRDFYMINNTDSIYSQIIPVEYPKAGESPSPAKVGVVDATTAKTLWMDIPGDPAQHYIARMEWTPDGSEIVIQQLNRKQNESKLMLCSAAGGQVKTIFTESDPAWVSHINEWGDPETEWPWLAGGKEFLWTSEKDGWRHIYRISRDGKNVKLITNGNFDALTPLNFDEKGGLVYFIASPDNATQRYLYRAHLDGKGQMERVTPARQDGTHTYNFSPNGKYAYHSFSNYFTRPMNEWIILPGHQALDPKEDISKKYDPDQRVNSNISFFKVTTEEGVEMDGWMAKPSNFDEKKKYPVVFYVYGEPAGATVVDRWRAAGNAFQYDGDLAEDGYIHVSLDNRGTPAPKGRQWRKSIYGKLGTLNIRDQALGAKKVLEWPFVDTSRVAVWGWSGGGSSTLNLMFQYPDIYKAGISVAPVTASYYYDNIYTERYMGLPDENAEGYKAGAAATHAKNLRGHLMLIHGTGDDNVHFQNSEALVNELIKQGKQFQYFAYPNRTHGISEGEGTREHLKKMISNYLRTYCPPGVKDVRP